MTEEDILRLNKLRKSIPKYKPFCKRLELTFLENFDKENDILEFVKKYSKEYYLLRELIINQLNGIFYHQYNFSKLRKRTIKRYRNHKRYLENENKSTETND